MLKKQFGKLMTRGIGHVSQEAIQEADKLRLVDTGRLRKSISTRPHLCSPTEEKWTNITSPPLVYLDPSGNRIIVR